MPRGARTGRAPGRGGASWAPGVVVIVTVSRGAGRVSRRFGAVRAGAAAIRSATLAGTMPILAVRRWDDLDAAEQARLLARSTAAIFEPALHGSIEALFEDVRARGDAAVLDATERFDGVRFAPQISASARRSWPPPTPPSTRRSWPASARRSATAASSTRPRSGRPRLGWLVEVRPGFEVGEQVAPIPSAGLYVPAGKGSFPSVLVQIGVPAVVAGVPEIAVLVPPMPGTGAVDPATLAVAHELGLRTSSGRTARPGSPPSRSARQPSRACARSWGPAARP